MKIAAVLILALALAGCAPDISYDSCYALDPFYVLDAAGIDAGKYIEGLKEEIRETEHDSWGLGDSYLILARMENSSEHYRKACMHFSEYEPGSAEESAVLYETMAGINCSGKRDEYMRAAADEWEKLGVDWRVKLLEGILEKSPELEFDTEKISPKINLSEFSSITIGKTKVEIKEGDRVLPQMDRVYRDWLGLQMNQNPFSGEILAVFSERLTYDEYELREDIGWHEGGRMRDLKNRLGITPISSAGAIVARHEGKWYAPDEKGIFRFEVPLDKVSYPTTRFFSESIGMIVDTHGVNMLAEQAIRKNADAVLSDCDHEDKTKAAVYLSEKNISVICFPDRYAYYALGHGAKLVSSPVWRFEGNRMIYGDAPLTLEKNQKIVVTNADIGKAYAIWYYTTPWLYFTEINKTFPLEIIPAVVDSFNQTNKVYAIARKYDAEVVAARVFNSYDYEQAKRWLLQNESNKIVLFHSTMYPYGILLMQEFLDQVSFGDVNPEGIH